MAMDTGTQGSTDLKRTGRLTLQPILFCRLVYTIITLTLLAASSFAKSHLDPHLKISPSIHFRAPSETLKVWVFFTDKGFSTASDQRRAIDQYQTQMSNRAQDRRELRAHLSRPDFTDLPIESRYIEAVLQGEENSAARADG